MVFLVTYVVPKFAELYSSMSAKLPAMTRILIAIGTTARNYIVLFAGALVGGDRSAFRWWADANRRRGEGGPREAASCRWWARSG